MNDTPRRGRTPDVRDPILRRAPMRRAKITLDDVAGRLDDEADTGMDVSELSDLLDKAVQALRETGSHDQVAAKLGMKSHVVLEMLLARCSDKRINTTEYDSLQQELSEHAMQARAAEIVDELAGNPRLAAMVASKYARWAR